MTKVTILDTAGRTVLDRVTATLDAGEAVAVEGPSGAGKSTLARLLLGHLPPGLRREGGTLDVLGQDPTELAVRARRRWRADHVAFVGQDPSAQLAPTRPVAAALFEVARGTRRQRCTQVRDALAVLGLPADDGFLARRPHELSGGQRRRIVLGRVLVRRPQLVIVDEPFAGLDDRACELVAAELTRLRCDLGATMVVVSHDRAARAATNRTLRLEAGRLDVATSAVDKEHATPRTARVPLGMAARRPHRSAALVIDQLYAGYGDGPDVVADVSLRLEAGSSLLVTGPSGGGKTTLARCVVGLHRPRAGRIEIAGAAVAATAARRRDVDRRSLAYIPQDLAAALNPVRTVGATLRRALRHHRRPADEPAVAALLHDVQLDAALADRRPDQLSGGQQQRVSVARALAGRPQLLVADEITSALDERTAAGVLGLLDDLVTHRGLAVLLVAHRLPPGLRAVGQVLRIGANEQQVRPRSPSGRGRDGTDGEVGT